MILRKLHLIKTQNLKKLNHFYQLYQITSLLECRVQAHQLWLIFIPKGLALMHTASLKVNLIVTGVLYQKLYYFFYAIRN